MPAPADTATILLCAGGMRLGALPIATASSNAMVPLNGRPVLAWILDDLARKGVRSVVVVRRDNDAQLAGFLGRAYARRMAVTEAVVPATGGSIVRSLAAGLAAAPDAQAIRVVLGDTLIEDPLDVADDFVYVGRTAEPDRWCVAVSDAAGQIVTLHDKQFLPGREHQALAGYYRFSDAQQLRASVTAALDANARELSAVLDAYRAVRPLRAVPVLSWFDFGNVDNYARAKLHLLRPRFFNAVQIDPVLHTLTKRSTKLAKLQDEVAWYKALPAALQVLAPRLLDSGTDQLPDGQPVGWYTIEYYGYPTLADLFVWGELELDVWLSILRRVLEVHARLAAVTGPLAPRDHWSMLFDKTHERLHELRRLHPEWHHLLQAPNLQLNGRTLHNVAELAPLLTEALRALVQTARPGFVHGDLCFSNILFDVPGQIVRLIDPRGSFGAQGPWGDPRYDLAKLRHSVCGGYDLLMADFFAVQEPEPGVFALQVWRPEVSQRLAGQFDELLRDAGHQPREVQLLESLLFLSMPPLHEGHADRQRAMYLYGLQLLNDVLLPQGDAPAGSLAVAAKE